MTSGDDRLAMLTIEEAADKLRCSRQTLYRLHNEDGLPFTKLRDRTLIREADLMTWLDARRVN